MAPNWNKEEFLAGRIIHPLLKGTIKELQFTIKNYAGRIIFFFGPTGIGKTTIIDKIIPVLTKYYSDLGEVKPGDIPVLHVEAPPPEGKEFVWRNFYKDTLKALNEPLPDNKCAQEFRTHNLQSRIKPPTLEYRNAMEEALEIRNVRVFLIDEANHMTKGASIQELIDRLDIIKSFRNKNQKLVIVLCGVYELLEFRCLNGQLSRRTTDVHFGRYHCDNREEYKMFANIVQTFEDSLPLPCTPPFVSMLDDMYAGSLGCVGLLKEWLDRAVERAYNDGAEILTAEILRKALLTKGQLTKMYQEIQDGERKLVEPADTLADMKAILGLAAGEAGQASRRTEPHNTAPPAPVRRQKRLPGEMNPRRFSTVKKDHER